MKEMNKQINLICSVCGNDQFSVITDGVDELLNAPDETEVKCSDCGRVTTKAQIIEENHGLIQANVGDFKGEIMDEIKKNFSKWFK
jgi:uncharacterized Zn finger protein